MKLRPIRPRILYVSAYVVFSMILPVVSEIMRMQYGLHTWLTEYLELYIALVPPLLLTIVIFRRSFQRVLPVFAIYVIYLLATGILQIVVPPDVIATRLGLFMGGAEAMIQVVLLYSILRHFCLPFPRSLKAANRLFVVAVGVLVGLALLSIWSMRTDPNLSQGGMHGAAMIGWSLVVSGLILFILVLKRVFALPADHPLLLITAGLGVMEAFDLIVSPVFMYYGVHRLLLLYSYEAISGGAGALSFALWFVAVLHHGDEPATGAQVDLDFSKKQMNDMSSAFARLIYRQ